MLELRSGRRVQRTSNPSNAHLSQLICILTRKSINPKASITPSGKIPSNPSPTSGLRHLQKTRAFKQGNVKSQGMTLSIGSTEAFRESRISLQAAKKLASFDQREAAANQRHIPNATRCVHTKAGTERGSLTLRQACSLEKTRERNVRSKF